MMCPECNRKTKVLNSRTLGKKVFRIRACECGKRFGTVEVIPENQRYVFGTTYKIQNMLKKKKSKNGGQNCE